MHCDGWYRDERGRDVFLHGATRSRAETGGGYPFVTIWTGPRRRRIPVFDADDSGRLTKLSGWHDVLL